jgi:RNA polymerase sigma factor (TIGR02999 family)
MAGVPRNVAAMKDTGKITGLLARAHGGDTTAFDDLARAVHPDLVRQARRLLGPHRHAQGGPPSLESGELVNETVMKLLEQRQPFQNSRHFFAITKRIMRRALLDYYKARGRVKRFGGQVRVSLSAPDAELPQAPHPDAPDVVRALAELEQLDRRLAQVVLLHAQMGLSGAEAAEVLGISRSTFDRDWRFARVWLAARLRRT